MPPSGWYLSFAEYEEIALLCVQGHGACEIARHLGRAYSTLSRELRRNAVRRSGGFESTGEETASIGFSAVLSPSTGADELRLCATPFPIPWPENRPVRRSALHGEGLERGDDALAGLDV